jgi:hypothetical protein
MDGELSNQDNPRLQQPETGTKPRFDASTVTIAGWHAHTVRVTRVDGVHTHFSLWVPANTQSYNSDLPVTAVEVFETNSADEARRLGLRLANDCQIGVTMERTAVGDAGYVGPGGIPVTFVRSNFAVKVMQAESAAVPALEVARALDQHLERLG